MSTDPLQQPAGTKLEMLMQMMELQKLCVSCMAQAVTAKSAGDLTAARHWYGQQIDAAERHLQLALLHNQRYEGPVEIEPIVQPLIDALFIQADVLEAQAEVEQANELRLQASQLSERHLGATGDAETERARAASLTGQGRFNEALVALARSRDIFLREENTLQVIRVTIDLVDLLNWLGDHTRALIELDRAARLIEPLVGDQALTQGDVHASILELALKGLSGQGPGAKAQDTIALYRAQVELAYYHGLIYKTLRRFDEAETSFRAVLPEYQKLGVGPAIEFQLAAILVARGDYQRGLAAAERIEQAFIGNGMMRAKLSALLRVQAEALANTGRQQEALAKLDRGIRDLATYYDPDLLWRLHWLKGRVLDGMRHEREALAAYGDAAVVINGLRRAPLGYRLDSTYLRDKLPVFEAAITLAGKLGLAEECCRLMEMIKSRLLSTTLGLPPRGEGTCGDNEGLAQRFDALTRQIEALEFSGYRDGGDRAGIDRQKEPLLAERAALMERIRFSEPRWRNLSEPVPFDYEKLLELLDGQKQNILTLFFTGDKIVGVLLKGGKGAAAIMDLTEGTRRELQAYLQNLQASDLYANPLLYDPSASLGLDAGRLVPQDLLEQALQGNGLIVVPHGPLHLLPWAGLIYKGKRLFEYCPVGILPNVSCLQALQADFSASPRVALIGAPDYSRIPSWLELPGAKREIEEIAALYTGKGGAVGKMTGPRATEAAFWASAALDGAGRTILHLACHGTIETDDPMHSGLILSDGRIDAAEIARAPLPFEEVILSACSSGWRPQTVQDVQLSGDDILGLPGAFFEAGARSVLVSIPVADDEAASAFMVEYHSHRVQGKTPLAALQETQVKMLRDAMFRPCKWVGFTIYGCR